MRSFTDTFLSWIFFHASPWWWSKKKKFTETIKKQSAFPASMTLAKHLAVCYVDTKILDHSLVSEYKCSPLSLTQVGHQSKVLEAFGAWPASLTWAVVHWGGKPRQSCCQPCSSLTSVVVTRETLKDSNVSADFRKKSRLMQKVLSGPSGMGTDLMKTPSVDNLVAFPLF
jgi:hypothetical protein